MMTRSKITINIIALNIKAYSVMTLRIRTLSIMTFSIITDRLKTLSTMAFCITTLIRTTFSRKGCRRFFTVMLFTYYHSKRHCAECRSVNCHLSECCCTLYFGANFYGKIFITFVPGWWVGRWVWRRLESSKVNG